MLVAIEGIDGAGKTSSARMLVDRLAARGLSVVLLEKETIRAADAFVDSRLDGLRALLWPHEPEPASDPFGTHFYLFLQAAWFAAVRKVAAPMLAAHDVVITDRSQFRVIAKAHVRGGLDIDWLASLFDAALVPDLVVLIALAPEIAWRRRASFKATEIGRWDGFSVDAEESFRRYQGAIRATLKRLGESRGWTVITPSAGDAAEAVTEWIEKAVVAKLAGRRFEQSRP
jgi:thymidylate kinase